MNVSFSVNLNAVKNYVVNKFKGHDEPLPGSHLPPETDQKKDAQTNKQVSEEEEAKPKTPKPQPQQQAQQTEQNPNSSPGGLKTTSRIDEHGMIEITYSMGGQKLIEHADPNSEYGKAWVADHPNDFSSGKKQQQASAKSDVPEAVSKLPPEALAKVNDIKTQTASTSPPSENASLPAVQKGAYLS